MITPRFDSHKKSASTCRSHKICTRVNGEKCGLRHTLLIHYLGVIVRRRHFGSSEFPGFSVTITFYSLKFSKKKYLES